MTSSDVMEQREIKKKSTLKKKTCQNARSSNNISKDMRTFGFKCKTFLGVIETVFGHQTPRTKIKYH